MESDFSRAVVSLVNSYGHAAVWAIDNILQSGQASVEVAEEALRWLASVDHPGSYKYRWGIVQKSLRSPSARIRDAAGLGLAAMDDPIAIGALEEAIASETSAEIREGFQLVLNQLIQTARCRSF
jgi:hypothetical protein